MIPPPSGRNITQIHIVPLDPPLPYHTTHPRTKRLSWKVISLPDKSVMQGSCGVRLPVSEYSRAKGTTETTANLSRTSEHPCMYDCTIRRMVRRQENLGPVQTGKVCLFAARVRPRTRPGRGLREWTRATLFYISDRESCGLICILPQDFYRFAPRPSFLRVPCEQLLGHSL